MPNFAAMDRKKRFLNRMLLVSGASALLLFAGYVIFTKRTPRNYFIPKGYEGWVTVKYEKEGAPPLPEVDGAYELIIPSNGLLETSTAFRDGWSRDTYFWKSGESTEEIPKSVDVNGEPCRYVHDLEASNMSFNKIILSLPDQSDTVLWEGTRISKDGKKVSVRTGRKVMEHFFVTPEATPFFFRHDSLPDALKEW